MAKSKPEYQLPDWTHWAKLVMEFLIVLAGIGGIYLTQSTLSEIKTQRIKSLEPELRINNVPFNMVCKMRSYDSTMTYSFELLTYNQKFDSSILIFPEDIKTHKKIKDWWTFDRANLFSIPVYNIGQGAALDISVKFAIDTTYFLKLLNRYSEIMENIDSAFIKQGKFILTHGNDTAELNDIDKTQNIQFIPDMSKTSNTFDIHFPSTYFKLLTYREILLETYQTFSDVLAYKYPELNILNLDKALPPITVILEYKDVNDISSLVSTKN